MRQGSVSVVTPSGSTQEWLVEFEAFIRLRVERSRIVFNARIPEQRVREGILLRPHWLDEWPPMVSIPGTDLLGAALTKMLGVLEFGSQFASRSGPAIERALEERFPLIRDEDSRGQPERYAVFRVSSTVWEDGSTQWSYYMDTPGALPPGVGAESKPVEQEGGIRAYTRSDLEVYLRDRARVDILERLGQITR